MSSLPDPASSRVTSDVERLTGHPPRSLRDFLGLNGG